MGLVPDFTSAAPARSPTKAGPIGSGASVLMTEYPLSILGSSAQDRMYRAAKLAISNPWIRAAERTIGDAVSTVGWHLEDGDDVEIDDDYTGSDAQLARALLEKPQANLSVGEKQTRSEFWRLTSRHMGACGSAFWYLDEIDLAYGIPSSLLYIAPWRMTPVPDEAGNLLGWLLDRNVARGQKGTKLDLREIAHFRLEPPDEGHFGIGIVESILAKAQLSGALDRHVAQVLAAGGRLAGIMAPKEGVIEDSDTWQSIVRDFRTIVDQPDAAKRLQVLRFPAEFTKTTMTPEELSLRDLMVGMRDDIEAVYGVPISQLGIATASGLNGGTAREADAAVFWNNAAGPRLTRFVETVQYQILDRWASKGIALELEDERPEFDDRAPQFELAAKSIQVALKNAERRELLGLPPFGPKVIGESGQPLDDEVWMPTLVGYAVSAAEGADNAPAPVPAQLRSFIGAGPTPATPQPMDQAAMAAGETPGPGEGKARAYASARSAIAARLTPRLQAAIGRVLAEQRAEITSRVRAHAEHIASQPKDTDAWWDGPKWDRRLREALRPHLSGIAAAVSEHTGAALRPTGKAGALMTGAEAQSTEDAAAAFVDRVVSGVLERGAARVTGINATTRDGVLDVIRRTIAAGVQHAAGPGGLGDELEAALGDAAVWGEYRSEMIARTELGTAYNEAALGSYRDLGVTRVRVEDGDGDDLCAPWAGWEGPIGDAPEPLGHPNCTRDIVPVIL